MPQDFAKRSPSRRSRTARSERRSNARNSGARSRSGAKQQPAPRFFHGPSFSGGVLLGALLLIATAYLPELLPQLSALKERNAATGSAQRGGQLAETGGEPAATERRPKLRFEYDQILSQQDVPSDPSRYEQPLRAEVQALDREYLLQAASFRTQDEANAARAQILLMDLPADTNPVQVRDQRWIRVTVGPFPTQVQAQRALTALREQAFAPIWIERPTT